MPQHEAPLINHLEQKEGKKLHRLLERTGEFEPHRDELLFERCLSDARGDLNLAETIFSIRVAGIKDIPR